MMAVDGGLGGLGGQTFGTVHAGVAALGFTSVVSRGLFAYALGALGALGVQFAAESKPSTSYSR